MMLLECKGIDNADFSLPPFNLYKGEIAIINLYNRWDIYERTMFIKDFFTGSKVDDGIILHEPFAFAGHIMANTFWHKLFPLSVGQYLKKNANLESNYATAIYDIDWMQPNKNVNSLYGNNRKLLSLYATLSRSPYIITDLAGVSPDGEKIIMGILKRLTENGGAAIIIDRYDVLQNECSIYLEATFK